MTAEFFNQNLDIVLFIYGLSFVALGIAILVQPRRGSFFKLAAVLRYLGIFAVMHGCYEWFQMWSVIKYRPDSAYWFELTGWVMLVISYLFLYKFGYSLLSASRENKNKKLIMGIWVPALLAAIIIIFVLRAGRSWQEGRALARYLMGLPSGVLASASIIAYYKTEIIPRLPGLRYNFYYAALFLFLYTILSGFVVSPVGFFPGNIINTASFSRLFGGIPVYLFRTVCALFLALSMGRILAMFRWETIKNLGLKQSERFTDNITSSIEEMIMIIDRNFRIKWANQKLRAAYGKDVLNKFCYKVTHHIDSPCQPPDDICPIDEAVKSEKPVSVIHSHIGPKGNASYVEVSVYPMLDEQNKFSGNFIHTSRDVTGRIKAQKELEDAYTELKAIQEKLLSAEKMASLGKLSAGIAHEINNPIGYVISNLSSLDKYVSDLLPLLRQYHDLDSLLSGAINDELKKAIDKIQDVKKKIDFKYILDDLPKLIRETADGAQRVVRIIRDLKSFARKDEIELKEADINELIESALNIIWNEVKYKADVVKEYGKLPVVFCHAQQITQVVMNIVVNAAQAIEEHGTITIKTYSKDKTVTIEISDTGTGMDEELQKMVFEPFFTTKKVGEGTGLGLAIVYGVIQKHKGSIEIKSRPGEGSTFIIRLPVNAPQR
ncbi:MAG: hypothetical protein COV72_02285 [Candidatus Omnitrophica bacterium CG11_big_fil_rev_8_21_14_0_20_42_13]|uniref:histidine kinase n=1 Tax=Candidatus Ghiorseimicrobium undicola TaxID=1974746 RepID=A0A2H0LYY4_9BACT|nr:MAG: hypothetical protein COV72_02285 [Candidatus Omnitrophica bacterium CG11_big_fil_rev_8_21_14_0_20_42_13]